MSKRFCHKRHLGTSDLSLLKGGMYPKDAFKCQRKLSIAVTNMGAVQKPNDKVVLKIFFNEMLIITVEYCFRRQLLKRQFQLSENRSMEVTDSSIYSACVFEGTFFISAKQVDASSTGGFKAGLIFDQLIECLKMFIVRLSVKVAHQNNILVAL